MPSLLPRLHFDETDDPKYLKLSQTILWQCSACDKLFWLGRLARMATIDELRRVDEEFRTHCKAEHAGTAIIGLVLKEEDVNPAAGRIVREATEKK